VPASAGALAGASVEALLALAATWEFSVQLSVAVPSSAPGDALSAALWAFQTLGADCALAPLPATPAAAAFAALPAPHVPFSYVLATPPPVLRAPPRVFSLPLPWTQPFEWRLWAVVGASILVASAAQAAFEGGGAAAAKRRERPAAARTRALRAAASALLGWRFTPPATPAGRLHATSFAFIVALLAAQYVAAASALAAAGGVVAAPPPAAVCVADNAAHAAFAAAALPALPQRRLAGASPAALLAALRSGECDAALLTDLDYAYAAGGPGDAAGAHCGLPVPVVLGRGVAALALAPATAANVTQAMGVLLAAAAAPGGAFAAAAAANMPAAQPRCSAAAAAATAAAARGVAPSPLRLRDLSGLFMLQVLAMAAGTALHAGGAATRALAVRRRDGAGRAHGAGGKGGAALQAREYAAAPAAENGAAGHPAAWGSRSSSDVEEGGTAALHPLPSPRSPRGAGGGAASPALRAAVAAMQSELSASDGHGWAPRGAARRSDLLAVEADAAALAVHPASLVSVAASAPPTRYGGARSRSRTPPRYRSGAVSAGPAQFAPAPRASAARFGGRPALPRDTGEDYLDDRL
jgi:hypothetical protein